jgi:hypothetical protein
MQHRHLLFSVPGMAKFDKENQNRIQLTYTVITTNYINSRGLIIILKSNTHAQESNRCIRKKINKYTLKMNTKQI